MDNQIFQCLWIPQWSLQHLNIRKCLPLPPQLPGSDTGDNKTGLETKIGVAGDLWCSGNNDSWVWYGFRRLTWHSFVETFNAPWLCAWYAVDLLCFMCSCLSTWWAQKGCEEYYFWDAKYWNELGKNSNWVLCYKDTYTNTAKWISSRIPGDLTHSCVQICTKVGDPHNRWANAQIAAQWLGLAVEDRPGLACQWADRYDMS